MGMIGQGYGMGNGRWANVEPITPAASAARTASGNGASIELGDRAVARLKLDVTAASGATPTLNVTLETSKDGSAWYTAGTFTQATGVTNESKAFAIDRFVRATWAIAGGTPSFTFSLEGEAARGRTVQRELARTRTTSTRSAPPGASRYAATA